MKVVKLLAKKLVLMSLAYLAMANVTAEQIKVACIGDSITFGAGIPQRHNLSYPAQLQNMLGKDYLVKNFGKSGRTLLKKGNLPYWQCDQFKPSQDFQPDYVFIKLGTNDSKMQNWKHKAEFKNDYKELIKTYQNLKSKPRVILLTPVPAFCEGNQISGSRVKNELIPLTLDVAFETGCEVIDLYHPLTEKPQWLPDKIHPNPFGAELMAKRIYEWFWLQPKKIPTYNVEKMLANAGLRFSKANYHGFTRLDFKIAGRQCHIIKPKVAVRGLPWIWRARFFGHEPQLEIALLERGYHVTYCDVAGLFGSPQAVALWNKFYGLTRKLKFNKKAVLEGMSRGGLIIYNWAAQNPEKVAAIYADAPVCDFNSWPGGKGTGEGAARQWKQCLKHFKMTESQAKNHKLLPINLLKPIAKADIPIIHVSGLADKVVPFEENGAIIEKRYKELGGTIKMINKKDCGHHPHSLPDPTPILRFILKHTGNYLNLAAKPMPGAEYRGGSAGWGGGTWWNQFENISKIAAENKDKIQMVFFGDSITQNWTGPHKRMAEVGGNRPIDKNFANYGAISMGISGDRTEHLLYRLKNGNFDGIKPQVVVLMIGVNNLWNDMYTGDEIAEGIVEIVKALRKKLPKAHIILHGPFATGKTAESYRRQQIEATHAGIKHLAKDEYVHYLPLYKKLIKEDGTLDYKYMSGDAIHLKGPAYDFWAAETKPLVDKIIK